MKTPLYILPYLLLLACSPSPVTDAGILAAAKPRPAKVVTLAPVSAAARDTGAALDRLGKQVDAAEREASEARRLADKQVLTIAELNGLLRQTDEDVDARVIALKAAGRAVIAKLEAEIKERDELDERRQWTIARLRTEKLAAAAANRLTVDELARNSVELQAVQDELDSYRELYPIAVQAVKEQGETAEAWRKDATKNQHYKDTRFSSILWAVGITSIFWLAVLVWQYFSPARLTSSLMARALPRSR